MTTQRCCSLQIELMKKCRAKENRLVNSSTYNRIFEHNDKKKATRVKTKTKK